MIHLHHCVAARSFRAFWMLEELGLSYQLTVWPFPPRVQAAGYLEVHPQGTVPLLIDGETRLAESAAICEYLVARHGGNTPLAVRPDEPAFGAWLQWLHFGEATLTFPQTLLLRYACFEPPERRQPQVVADYTQWFFSRLRTLDAALQQPGAGTDHVCAGRFTAADASLGYALLLADELGLSARFKPAVAAYWQALQQRPAFQRARQAERDAAIAQGVSPASAVPRLPGA
ncbi:glutathione S-transferase family protein [Leptothrix discophora]|uniref:Glutathione S-transferase family protein n=1 Tax=Leptothrix discophora TaxID=89 RepID=A0ABT9G1E5_LEPDI|nr:glutathione S-transferase family protein [Leptothrix discophora]MDP4300310.1 glutathione S-transferase family protein [Leptothrix discophora]